MNQREQMEAEVKKWRESGLKKKEYCQQHGITVSTFSYWITRINQSSRKGFVALTPASNLATSTIEVIYPNGVRIKVPASDLKTISQLISLC